MKKGIAAIVVSSALAAAGCAEMNPFQRDEEPQQTTAGAQQGTERVEFSQVDRDRDDNISKTEAQEAGLDRLVENWERADKDRDDVLDQSEFSTFMEAQ